MLDALNNDFHCKLLELWFSSYEVYEDLGIYAACTFIGALIQGGPHGLWGKVGSSFFKLYQLVGNGFDDGKGGFVSPSDDLQFAANGFSGLADDPS